MCDPLSIGGAILTVGGALAQNAGAKKATKAREGAARAETERQAKIDAEQAGVFDDTLGKFDRPRQDVALNDARARRAAAVDDVVQPTNPAVPVAGSAPKVVKSTIAKALTDALGFGRRQGIAQGNLASFGDLSFGNGVDLARSGRQQATLGNFSARSAGILPMELEAANSKGAGLRSFGGLLSGAGQLAGLGGALGAGPTFGELFGKTIPAIPGMPGSAVTVRPLRPI